MRQLGGQRKMEDLTGYGLGTTFSFARVNREPVNSLDSKLRYTYVTVKRNSGNCPRSALVPLLLSQLSLKSNLTRSKQTTDFLPS